MKYSGEQGQIAFIDCQFNILTSLCTHEHIVVTTDPSVACSEKNRQLLRNEMTVWLDVSMPIQIERTLRKAANLLPIPSLELFFDQLHAERDGLYNEVAKLAVQGDDGKLEGHVNYIVKTIFGNKILTTPLKPTLEKKDFILFHRQLHIPVHLSEQQAIYLNCSRKEKQRRRLLVKLIFPIEQWKVLLLN